jgi:hypothetical protein
MIQFDEKNIDFEGLKKPFNRVRFRPMMCYNSKITLVAYLDSRDVMKRLDDCVGATVWQCDYKEIKNNLFCGIGIGNVWKWDCGTESNMDKEKGESSDAFKRAAVRWGVGRYLYYLPKLVSEVLPSGEHYIKIQDKGTGKTITGYYNTPRLPDWAYPLKNKKETK